MNTAGLYSRFSVSMSRQQMIRMAAAGGKAAIIECDPRQEITRHIAVKYGFARTESRDGLDVYRFS